MIVWREVVERRDGEYAVVAADSEMPVAAELHEQALEIAESATCPAWEIG